MCDEKTEGRSLEIESGRTEGPEGAEVSQSDHEEERPRRGMEGFYENFRGVPLKYLDAFIVFCFVALIAVLAHGILRAKGIL